MKNASQVRCLNCATPIIGPYCHTCGQKDEPRVQPIRALVVESIAEILSLDGRLWRTLRLLLSRPGFLTNEYIAGRRSTYVGPFRLYLLVSVVYFLVLALTGFDTFFFVGASPNSIAYEYMDLLPKIMFVILPAFALLLKLLYPNRLYVEHVITSLHLHAVMFVLLSLHTIVINGWGFARTSLRILLFFLIDFPIQLAVFVYFFLTLRAVYGQSRMATAFRMLLLIAGYLGVLTAIGAVIINADRMLGIFHG